MADPVSISRGIAARYATALFELAREAGSLAALEADIQTLDAALKESPDLRQVIASPLVPRAEQRNAIEAVGKKAGLNALTGNTLALMAEKRRLFVLPQLLRQIAALIADEKNEAVAEIVSATTLTAAQSKKLAEVLTARAGKNVKLNIAVDESLIGGLVVRLGSIMIDTSVSSKLAALQNAMKEVG